MSHVLRSAKLLTPDQRIQRPDFNILHQIGDYIQQAHDMDSILHVVLTGVTAGYGLGLNRATLFLLDDTGESLVGRMGIGNLDERESRRNSHDHHRDHREDLRAYIRLLEAGALVETPVGRSIRSLSVPLTASGLLGQVLEEGKPVRLESADLALLPQTLVAALALSAPAVIVPLRMGQRPVGVLVADNKFTKVPIGDELLEALVTFVSTATVVIRNYDLWDMTRRDKERLQRFLKASTALVASEAPKQSVEKTIEAAMQASGAAGVSLILLNSEAEMLDVVAVGIDREHPDLLVRKDGLSMQVLRDGHFEKIENADTEREKRSINSYMLSRDVKAALCLPVQAEGERLGVMWFHFAEPHVFTETEIGDFQFFVNQAALAHDSARRLETLEEMRRAATALTQATETRAVLAAIVAHACSVMRARAAWVWPYDDEACCFRPEGFAISDGVDGAAAEWIRKSPPRPGGTTELVMKDGFIPVESIADRERYPFLDDDHRSNLPRGRRRELPGRAAGGRGEEAWRHILRLRRRP